MPSILITGGTVVTASEQFPADVYLRDGLIAQIGTDLRVEADEVVAADGQYVIPGGIDVHTHLGEEVFNTLTADTWESGTVAAAFGGTTTVVDFARQEREGMSPLQAIERRRGQAAPGAVIDYGFHLMATNLSSPGYIEELRALPGEGVTSFKLLMAYPGTMMVDDLTIYHAMQVAAETGALVTLHAENGHVIQSLTERFGDTGQVAEHMHMHAHPHLVEGEAVHRGIALAEMAGAGVYIVHLSSHTALTEVEAAKARGQAVWAETCPQYLFAAYEDYEDAGFEAAKYICSPPIRERANQEHLWRGLETGALSVLATDHCTFRMHDDLPDLPAAEADGPRRLPPHPQRRARHREPAAPALRRRRRGGALRHVPLRRSGLHDAGQAVRPLPAQGRHRRRRRRRHRGLGPGRELHDRGQHAPHARRLQPVRGHDGPGPPDHGDLARRDHRQRRRVPRDARARPIPAADDALGVEPGDG